MPARTPPPSALEIPGLKKKEKERKGAGAALHGSGGTPQGALFGTGAGSARVGAGLTGQSGFLGTGKAAAAIAKMFGGPSTVVGGVFASKLGAPLIFSAGLAWAGIMGAAAYKLLGLDAVRSNQQPSAMTRATTIDGAGDSGIVIDKPGAHSLDYLADANKGSLPLIKKRPPAAKPVEEEAADASAEVEELPVFEPPDVSALMKEEKVPEKLVKSRNPGALGSGLKLAGGSGMAGGVGMRFKGGFQKPKRPKTKLSKKIRAPKRSRTMLLARRLGTSSARSNRTMGQLKFARNMSASGAGSGADSRARQYATNAFEQGQTTGEEGGGISETPNIVVPPGAGTPNGGGGSSGLAPPPDTGSGKNVTPYQDKVDGAKKDTQSSKMLIIAGAIMMALGAVLLAFGIKMIAQGASLISLGTTLSAIPFIGQFIGPPIIKAGTALKTKGIMMVVMGSLLLAGGLAMIMMGMQKGKAAKDKAEQIEEEYGQEEQGDVIDECADQAMAKSDCNPQKIDIPETTVQEDAAEESNANYSTESSGGS